MANANAQQATPEVGAMKVIIFNTAIYWVLTLVKTVV
jgi:hypothetical protein